MLKALINAGYQIGAVVTAPDGKDAPPAKKLAIEHGLEILQPKNFRDDAALTRLEEVAKQSAVGIVVDYGKIIPAKFLALPQHGMLNIHGSLLPKYRGPSPIQYALLNDETETGVTVFVLDEKIDHGPILGTEREPIKSDDTYYLLKMRLVEKGSKLLLNLLPKYLADDLEDSPQDDSKATFTKIITREDGKVDWEKTAKKIYNQFRAFHKWPGLWFKWQGKILKIIDCKAIEVKPPLSRLSLDRGKIHQENGRLFVLCSKDYLELLKVQLEGGKVMDAKEFINGYGKFLKKG